MLVAGYGAGCLQAVVKFKVGVPWHAGSVFAAKAGLNFASIEAARVEAFNLHRTGASGKLLLLFFLVTPIDDGNMQLCQWLFRNDAEEDCPAQIGAPGHGDCPK